jgi:hypothetical protein
MTDNLDFFEDYADSQGKAQVHGTAENSGGRGDEPKNARPQVRRSTPLSRIAVLIGIAAVITSGLFLAHAVAPAKITLLNNGFGTIKVAMAAAALSALALVLGIVARCTVPRFQRSNVTGSWSIVCFVCTLLLLAGGFVVQNLFPTGIVKETVRDEAPTSSVAAMEQEMERNSGTCTDGWQAMGVSEYPGVSSIEACKNPRMAFIVFSNESAASLYRGAAEQKIASLLNEYSDKSEAQGDWRILNGKQWLAFAQASEITKLQRSWGGTISEVE